MAHIPQSYKESRMLMWVTAETSDVSSIEFSESRSDTNAASSFW